MKRTIFAWLGIIILVGLLGAAYVYWQNTMKADQQNAAQQQAVSKSSKSEQTGQMAERATAQPGVFIDYSEGQVASTDGVRILFFHAPWCPQCRMIEEDINRQGVPDGVTILKVDYDSNQALRQKYGVTLQTTFVEVDTDGKELEKFVAYNEPTFDSVKANLIEE